jgi:hypothetical protein
MICGRRLAVMLTVFVFLSGLTSCSATGNDAADIGCAPKEVVGWGDSLTYSATENGDGKFVKSDPTWLDVVGDDLHIKTKNFGNPAEGSAEIAVRHGGLKPAVTLSGDQIPAGTTEPSIITAVTPSDGWSLVRHPSTLKMHGSLVGVSGTLQHRLGSGQEGFAFLPDTAPTEAIPVPPQSLFVGDQGNDYRDCIQTIWAGTNNAAQPSAIIRDIASITSTIPDPKRYLVIGTVASTGDELSATYGTRFVNLRDWLITDGLSAAGVAPTPEDAQAVAAGKVPPSLTVDGAHFTQAAYVAIGHYIASVLAAQR